MGKDMKCWEFFDCSEEDCPAHKLGEARCWLVADTRCRNQIQGKFLEKIEMCLTCEAFKANMDVGSIEATLDVCGAQFKAFRRMVEQRDAELEGIGTELALGLSEVLEALKQIASGNPDVRISEDARIELLAKLKSMVNQNAESQKETVNLAHEFAMGLAEHFDVLNRVTKGDLAARVKGASPVELLESLKNVTNVMIESVSREISERRDAEEALRGSERRLSQIVHGSPIPTLVINANHIVTHWNRACETLTGISADHIVGTNTHWSAFYTAPRPIMADMVMDDTAKDDVDKYYSGSYHESAVVDEGYEGEDFFPNLGEEGKWLFFTAAPLRDKSGKVIGAIETLQDVTGRKQAEERLRDSEEILRTMTQSAQDAILMMDHEGSISFWNRAAERIFEYSSEEALGKELHRFLPPSRYYEAYRKGFGGFRGTGQGPAVGKTLELTACRKDGEEFPIELSLSAVKQKGKWNAIGIVRDITERKGAEECMQKAREEAELANQAKSQFLAMMSHEIRTPMNAIIGMTGLALDTKLTAEQREYLDTVRASGDWLLTVINEILDFSKIESGKLDLDLIEFNLPDNVGDTLKSLAVRAHEKGLELAYQILPEVPETVIGDSGRLRQILVNLVGNAIKFTDEGEVVVRVENVSATEGKIALRFTVTDTGLGIPCDKQGLIFDPFTQGDGSITRKHGGTGLGLPITKSLVELMGGRIWVESRVGEGTTFCFTAYFDHPEELSVLPMPVEPIDVRGLQALVVDDNATNRRILQEMLTRWHMKPTAVESGKTALTAIEQARERGSPFDLVLLDAAMPEMDGFTLADEVRKRLGLVEAVIMMLTSAGQPGDGARCRELGIAAYLTKPIKQSDLLDAIVTVMTYRKTHEGRAPLITRHLLRSMKASRHPKKMKPLKILVAEDNPDNQRLVVRMLEKQGHTVEVANNGREAVSVLATGAFDLVLMDVQMPEMDGFGATREIRSAKSEIRSIPIIALTAHAMKGDREGCLEAGMDAYVSKPIKPEALFAEIEKLVTASRKSTKKVLLSSKKKAQRTKDVFDSVKALKVVEGDMELFREITALFLKNMPDNMAQIREGIAKGNGRNVERAAHRLKASVGNFAAERAFEAANRLELMGREGRLDKADSVVSELERELTQLEAAIKGFMG